jgi:hypothetical protein
MNFRNYVSIGETARSIEECVTGGVSNPAAHRSEVVDTLVRVEKGWTKVRFDSSEDIVDLRPLEVRFYA